MNNTTLNTSILLVEDEEETRNSVSEMISRRFTDFYLAGTAEEAVKIVNKHKPDIILSDIQLPNMNGLQMVERLKQKNPKVKTIIMTAFTDTDYLRKSIDLQVDGYIVKPIHKEKLLSAIQKQADIILDEKRIIMQEEELKQYTQQLEERNKDLDSFSHTVAHDLKGPLGNIQGFSSLILDEFDTLHKDDIKEYLNIIVKQGVRTNQIIDSLLLLANVRKAKFETVELDMADIIDDVLERLSPMIKEKNTCIKITDKWHSAIGYPAWIEEVWINYLSNALKYGGSSPQIEIGCDTINLQEKQKEHTRFWIKDSGPGISAANQKLIFEKFERLNKVDITGYGLGLSIVYNIINKLNGKVGVESRIGKGSLFYFTLPSTKHKSV